MNATNWLIHAYSGYEAREWKMIAVPGPHSGHNANSNHNHQETS